MQRIGWVAQVKPEQLDRYVELHAAVWPGVLQRIKDCNIRNYSIFLKTMPGGEHFLFSYLEYTGSDFDADMQHMAADAETQRWWDVCKPCLTAVEELPPGEVWSPMQQIFFQE